ncbi:MAG: ATP-binding cassette domain-containing protein [Verrucomicrobia bacterium]|nr:ATP-binding cassette domain-containing protein [Verrucomicrobiota bacterium]
MLGGGDCPVSGFANDFTAQPSGGEDVKVHEVIAGLRGVSKSFGGTVALEDVSLELRSGEVLALLGENGAGKSTCVKLLAGVYRPDQGHTFLEGYPLDLSSPLEAHQRGIAVMHQHPGLFDHLSVAENIFIGHARKNRWGFLDHAGMNREASRLLEVVGLSVGPDELLGRLRISERQLVEIAKALAVNARVLIMDEPTAALSQREVDRLFSVVAELRKRRVAMMFVSHRMEEIYRVADRIAVLRDGRLVAVTNVDEMPHNRAVQLMVGRPLSDMYPTLDSTLGKTVLTVEGLTRSGVFREISFTLRAGEILGFGGLVGSGRTEIARVLFGVDQPTGGSIRIADQAVSFRSPAEAMKAGIAYVSEDRIGQSLVMDFGIITNASLPVIDQATQLGLVQYQRELDLVKPHLDRLRLRFGSFEQPVSTLSGGNQQKVVLSKWLATTPKVMIFDEPTQGVDVQTKAEVHAVIANLARHGVAIILISSELPELVSMCHRVLVLKEGDVTAEFAAGEASQEAIMSAAVGSRSCATGPLPSDGVASSQHGSDNSPTLPGFLRKVFARRELGLIVAMGAVVIPVSAINPRMLSGSNLVALSMDAALLSIVAAAQMLVIITRNIDLSVASIIGLSAYISADTLRAHPGLHIFFALLLACGVGLGCGLINGLVVTVGRVPAIVVTLGTLALYRGFDSLIAHGKQISADQVPPAWLDLTGRSVVGIPGVAVIALVVLLVLAFVLRNLAVGRELFAIGSNPEGARLIGVPVQRRVLGAFAVGGLLAGFDGALWASRYATIDARVASGFELTVIAAVVVGGVGIRGGSGTILGIALGGLTLLVIRNGLTLVRVDPLWLQGVYGLVILAAITIDAFVARSSRREPTETSRRQAK